MRDGDYKSQSDEIGRHSALKMRRPVGRAGSSPATGTGGSETVEYECACARVVADIGACSPVVGAAAGCVFLWWLVRGFLLRAARARWLFCFPLFGQ